MKEETELLREFHKLAQSILRNSKGEVLLTALRRGFSAAAEAQKSKGAPSLQQKALIFTESRRTQDYLFRILEQTEFGGKVVLFNGTNADPKSNEIYHQWLEKHSGTDRVTNSPTADKRAALVDYFRDEAAIMIATEAAAEGINLQFCNLVVNYDLPWNPQRIEQRIGRCHRYGQKFDVVVVNFLNRSNAADQRVYRLLDEKFKLFNGVFGASDEVLGAIESGVDFEKRIIGIYQKCRTPIQIEFEFDQLQRDLEEQIGDKREEAREQLLNNFDQEVIEKVKVSSSQYLGRYEDWLWEVTRFFLQPYASFGTGDLSFVLDKNPFAGETINPGPYRMGKKVEDVNTYRVGHPLAQRILTTCKTVESAPAQVAFHYSGSGKKVAVLEPLMGKSGWLLCTQITITAFEAEDHIIFGGLTDAKEPLDQVQCRRLFDLKATVGHPTTPPPGTDTSLETQTLEGTRIILDQLANKNRVWFDVEMDKLDRWAEDLKAGLEREIKEIDKMIRELRKQSALAIALQEKLDAQKTLKKHEATRTQKRRELFESQDRIDQQRDALIGQLELQMKQQQSLARLFLIRWTLN